MAKVSDRLRVVMKLCGYPSVNKMAEGIGLKQSRVNPYFEENSDRRPSWEFLEALGNHHPHISYDYLILEKGGPLKKEPENAAAKKQLSTSKKEKWEKDLEAASIKLTEVKALVERARSVAY